MKRLLGQVSAFAFGFLYMALGCSPVWADDTEIYFGNVGPNAGAANILFILDTSGSMSTDDDHNGTSRMDDLKTAFKGLISQIQNVNVGMMRFSDPGGPVLYPVANINKTVYSSADGNVSSTVAANNDDGYQFNSSGVVVLGTTGLEMGTKAPSGVTIQSTSSTIGVTGDDASTRLDTSATTVSGTNNSAIYLYSPSSANDGSRQRVVGMRFEGVQVPSNATIVRAYVQLETGPVGLVDNNSLQLSIVGEKTDQGLFDTTSKTPQLRLGNTSNLVPRVSGVVNPVTWSIDSSKMPATDDIVRTVDIAPIVQAMVNDSSWTNNNGNVSLLSYKALASTSLNWIGFSSFDRGTNPPKLVVEYYTGTATPSSVTTAVRFTSVNIPKGATITSAKISFTAQASDSVATDLVVQAEKVGNSAALTTTANNITSRTKTTASVSWAGVPAWTSNNTYDTPDLTTVVQEVANYSGSPGWCGGNAMTFFITGTAGRRLAEAYEDGSQTAPVLTVKYDPASVPSGTSCRNTSVSSQVLASTDDAEQYSTTNVYSDQSLELVAVKKSNTNYKQEVGLRFNNIKIPKSSTITSAYLQFTANASESGAISLTINGQAADNPGTFTTNSNDISNRPLSTHSISWSPSAWTSGSIYNSPDITSIVQELVNRSGWSSGNSMAMLITSTDTNASNTNNRRTAAAYDKGQGVATKLIINYQDTSAPSSLTVRDMLTTTADTLNPAGYTPIQDVMYEAAKYFRGEPVYYGTRRGGPPYTAPTTTNDGGPFAYTRVSHPDSYTGGLVSRPSGCTDANLGASACAGEVINGSPTYVSPITSSCQVNHIVLLTDGLANRNHSDSLVQSMIGSSSCADAGTGMACVQDLAGWMYNNDMSSAVTGKQNIITDTIAFNLTDATATNFLNRVATSGGGKSYSATNAADLATVFSNILVNVQQTNTSFVSAGTAVNAFNRSLNRDELYFSVFEPSSKPLWPGNLKKYKLDAPPSLAILDANGVNAVDANGFFAAGSQSFWSTAPDGPNVKLGGAAGLITNYAARNVYTYLDDIASPNKTLTASVNNFASSNTNLTQAEMGVSGYTAANLADLIDWSRGKDVLDENGNGITDETRFLFADPLHSRPVAVTYGGTDASPDMTIFITTNAGFLHAINNATGQETFSFIPKDLLPLQQVLYANSPATSHPSGLDGSITVWVTDPDGDGVVLNSSNQIESGNSVALYFGMRRGGRNYYAMDVTDRANPKIMWVIKGGTTAGFNNLGQTWSQPLKAKINVGGTVHNALIFGGGYDPNQDTSAQRDSSATDSMGNAVYIVDAQDGSLLWSGSSATGSTAVFSDMKYGIPSNITGADINGDGLMDVLFVGDMGGQVWRFDIKNGNAASSLVGGGVIADLNAAGGTATPANNRRFYHAPALFIGVNNNVPYLGVAIGSGWRAHPLNTATDDQFFMIRQTDVFAPPSSYTKLTEADLFDATTNVIGEGTATQKSAALTQLQTAKGWYITLPNDGEKVLSTPLVVEGQLFFDTYQPGTAPSNDPCSPSTGINRSYTISAFDATPINNYNGVIGLQAGDRSQIINAVGIIDQQRQLIRLGTDGQLISVGLEGTATKNLPSSLFKKVNRIYWYENR